VIRLRAAVRLPSGAGAHSTGAVFEGEEWPGRESGAFI
jgi:hypothetical protein